MKNFINTCAILACMVALITASAQAQGGIDWTVTIRNPTSWKAKVLVNSLSSTTYGYDEIGAGATKTVHMNANCPTGLDGVLTDTEGHKVHIQSTDMNGTWYSDGSDGGASCWHHKIKICSMPGKEGKFEDKAYSFCKE